MDRLGTFLLTAIFIIPFGASAATLSVPSQYATIQAAVASSTNGDVINIASGTYIGQIIIHQKNITLQGAGEGFTIITTTSSANNAAVWTSPSVHKGIIGVQTSTVTIQNLTIDGQGKEVDGDREDGISMVNSGGVINHVTTQHTHVTPYTAYPGGIGIYNLNVDGTSRTLSITSSSILDYQAGGIVANDTGLNATIDGNIVTGAGAIQQLGAENGIQIGFGAAGTVANNIIRNNICATIAFGCGTSDPINDVRDFGILLYQNSTGTYVTNNIIDSNDDGMNAGLGGGITMTGNLVSNSLWEGLVLFPGTYVITNNTIASSTIGIFAAFYDGLPTTSTIVFSGNAVRNTSTSIQIIDDTTAQVASPTIVASFNQLLQNGLVSVSSTNATIDLSHNFWGTASSTVIQTLLQNNTSSITFLPFYLNPAKTILNSAVSGTSINSTSTNFDLATSSSGQAALPSGVSTLTLSGSTTLSMGSTTNQVSGGQVILRGATTTLANFTSGSLTNQNISAPQTIGGVSVTVGQAVALSSGIVGTPILIQNSSLPSTTLSIPDNTAVLAPSGWNGTIAPPTTGSTAGTMPSGYSSVSNVVDAGSSLSELLFDTPTTITLSGVTGTLGYKAAGGSSWTAISTCAGSYASPTNPVFPGECSVSDGVNTKVLTFHLTSFGVLAPSPSTSQTSNAGAGGGYLSQFDTVPPINPTLSIENGAASTPSRIVVLHLHAEDSPGGSMTEAVQESSTFSSSTWLSYTEVLPFTLSQGIGQKTVYARFKDAAGNLSAVVSSTILLTTNASLPSVPVSAPSLPAVPSTTLLVIHHLAYGMKSAEVKTLQTRLKALGYLTATPNGVFGPATKAAVIALQKAHHLELVGEVGPGTRAILNQ